MFQHLNVEKNNKAAVLFFFVAFTLPGDMMNGRGRGGRGGQGFQGRGGFRGGMTGRGMGRGFGKGFGKGMGKGVKGKGKGKGKGARGFSTSSDSNGKRVFVSNLPFFCVETQYRFGWQDLKDFMKTVGPVMHCEIYTNPEGLSSGNGLVEFFKTEDAQKAIAQLNEAGIDC